MRTSWVLALVLIATAGFCGPARAQERVGEFRIGLVPERNVFDQAQLYEPLARLLTRELGRPVRLTMLSQYGSTIDAIRSGKVHGAFLGSFVGALAMAQLDMDPVARPVNDDDTSTYSGRIFVRRGLGIQTVDHMRGKRLALVDKATTAGYLYPRAYFQRHGVGDLDTYFSEVRYWGSHDAVILAVLDGKADIGAAKNTVFEWLARADPRVDAELLVLTVSDPVPSNALFVAPSVDSMLRAKLAAVLASLETYEEGRIVLARLGAKGFRATHRKDYDPVYRLAAEAGVDLVHFRVSSE